MIYSSRIRVDGKLLFILIEAPTLETALIRLRKEFPKGDLEQIDVTVHNRIIT